LSPAGLEEINKSFNLTRGNYPPDSIKYANDLLAIIGDHPRATLEEPLCAVFVKFKSWQIEPT
jgi:hypothetical protein